MARRSSKPQPKRPSVPGTRLVKKYGNRRLYDHTQSRAVTMEELAQAARRGEEIQVLDGKSGADLTRRILVQILLDEKSRAQLELLPIAFLRQLLCNQAPPALPPTTKEIPIEEATPDPEGELRDQIEAVQRQLAELSSRLARRAQ